MANDIRVKIFADATEFIRGLREAETRSQSFGSKLGGLAKAATIAGGAAIGGALVIGLDKSIEAAMEAEKQTARLDAAFKAAGLSASDYKDQIASSEETGRTLGFTNAEVRDSLATLTVATHDAHKSFDDLTIAEDLARLKHESLDSASQTLAKAMSGSARAVKSLGLELIPVHDHMDALGSKSDYATLKLYEQAKAAAQLADKQEQAGIIIDKVAAATKGQSEAFAKTAEGGMAQFHAQLDNLEEKIGSGLLPAFTQMIAGANRAIDFMTKNWPEIQKVVNQAWDSIRPDLNAAHDLFEAVAKIVEDHWPTISKIATDVGKVVQAQMKVIGDAIHIVTDILQGDWGKAWHDAESLVSDILGSMKAIVKADLDAIVAVAGGLGSALVGAIEGPINAFIDKWNSLGFDLPSISILGHKIGGEHIGVPQIPHLASGGIVTQPTLALIGESGPEAVVPLGSSGVGSVTVHVHGNVVGQNGMNELAQTIRKVYVQQQRRGTALGF